MSINISVGTTKNVKEKLENISKKFYMSKSKAANILIEFSLFNETLKSLDINEIVSKKISKDKIKRNRRADKMEVNLSICVSEEIKKELDFQSKFFGITNSRAVNIILEYAIKNHTIDLLFYSKF